MEDNYGIREERLEWLDMARGISIISIILGHIYATNVVKIWICSFHVPLFFIISGCLIKYKSHNDLKKTIITRVRTVLLPYILFGIIYILIEFILTDFDILILVNDIKHLMMFRGVGALWYLPTFFIAECLFIALKNILKKEIIVLATCITLFVLCLSLPYIYYTYEVLMLVRVSVGVLFISFGYYLFEYIKRTSISYAWIGVMLFLNIVLSNVNGLVDLYSIELKNVFLYIANAILGAGGCLFLCKKLKCNRHLKWMGTNSLIIMCTHQNLIFMLRRFTDNTLNGYILGLFCFLFVLTLEIPVVAIINNYCPFMIGKRIEKVNALDFKRLD